MEHFPSGVTHIPDNLEEDVYTCWNAAMLRNIYLESELKSLILEIDKKLFLFHGTGNRSICFKKLKKYGSSIKILPMDKLVKLFLSKGLINPFNTSHIYFDKVLICTSVIALHEVFTNDGTANGTIKFCPEIFFDIYQNTVIEYFSTEHLRIFDAPLSYKKTSLLYNYKLGDTSLELISHKSIFKPTRYADLFKPVVNHKSLKGKNICDMGTGSGVFGISASLKGARVTAIDINPFSVMAAHINSINNATKINAIHSNCFSSLPESYLEHFDLILCNPPTVPDTQDKSDLNATNWNFNGDGRLVLDTVILESANFLKKDGKLVIASSSQQGWNKTLKTIEQSQMRWRILSKVEIQLSELYLPYADYWHGKGLISKIDNVYFHNVTLIELTRSSHTHKHEHS